MFRVFLIGNNYSPDGTEDTDATVSNMYEVHIDEISLKIAANVVWNILTVLKIFTA